MPPIPSILVPGNHDLGLHSPSSSLAAYARERFSEGFGPTWGEREWNGWSVVWVDAMALLEPEFVQGDIGGEYSEMKQWLDDLGDGEFFLFLSHRDRYLTAADLTSSSPTQGRSPSPGSC